MIQPNPGSPEARKKGCRCAVLDNHHGRGAYRDDAGVPQFWITEGCSLHAPSNEQEKESR